MHNSKNITNLDLTSLQNLSPAERELALSILQEYATKGTSDKLNELLWEDYDEIPVDIETFVDDYNYLGNAWHDSEGKTKLYPYWRKELKKIFPDNVTTKVNNVILSGSRGRGKTEIATLIAAYLLYRILCLKDPVTYFHLKPTEKIVFGFMNIKKELAEEIGISKFQNTLQSSPWFLSHGTLEGRTKKIWIPKKFNNQEAIDIKIGSQADDLIGLPIYFCLDGDTSILTYNGIFKIKDLQNQKIKVPTISNSGSVILSDECTVKQTAISDIEYEIELIDGTIIKCTPTHRFKLINGEYKEAQNLTEQDEILDFNPYGYIYKITNLINGKIYIGQHKGSYLDLKYFGSGFTIQKAILKYGIVNFTSEILELCSDKKELDEREKFYISTFNSTNPNIGYNISIGGQGGDLGPEARKHISEKLKGVPKSEEHKKKLSNINKGKHLSNITKNKISIKNLNKIVSEETKIKMSNSAKLLDHSSYKTNKGLIVITNGINIQYIDPLYNIIPEGWYQGNCKTSGKHDMSNYYNSPELKIKKSLSHLGSKNGMYGKGYLRTGGNNTNSLKYYIFKDIRFECRKDLIEYLHLNGYTKVSPNLIRSIENKTYKNITIKKFQDIIQNLVWGYKYEN